MKNLIRLLLLLFIVSSCDPTEPVIYDEANAQLGLGFTTDFMSVIVPEDGVTVSVPVLASQKASADRTFDLTIEESIGDAANYTIGTLTIPADTYEGSVDVTFSNFSNLAENELYKLVIQLDLPDSVGKFDSQIFTFEYLKKILCNDFLLTVNTDFWSDETTWDVKDDTGAVLQSGGPYPRVDGGATQTHEFNLADGTYIFTMYDSWGDGMVTTVGGGATIAVIGSYTLNCGLINHANGGGAFGSLEETEFYVNQ